MFDHFQIDTGNLTRKSSVDLLSQSTNTTAATLLPDTTISPETNHDVMMLDHVTNSDTNIFNYNISNSAAITYEYSVTTSQLPVKTNSISTQSIILFVTMSVVILCLVLGVLLYIFRTKLRRPHRGHDPFILADLPHVVNQVPANEEDSEDELYTSPIAFRTRSKTVK